MRLELLKDAQRSAVAFDAVELQQLAGTREDAGTGVYAAVKERLRRVKAVDPRVRYVYIFRVLPATGKVVFLAGSAIAGVTESLPGDEYPGPPKSPGLQEIIRTGQPATEGPLSDAFGNWITAYAAIGVSGEAGAARREILGVDVGAVGWRRELWQAALQGALAERRYAFVVVQDPECCPLILEELARSGYVDAGPIFPSPDEFYLLKSSRIPEPRLYMPPS